MEMRKFNKAESTLIADTTNATSDAIKAVVRQFFAHYVAEHTNDEDEVLTVTEFYEHLQTVLSDLHEVSAEEIMSESAAHIDNKEKK